MEIIKRQSGPRVDPRHPESTDPTWQRAFISGQKRIAEGALKFNDRGEEEHYWKMVRSNPANVPGLPPFFPPLEVRAFGVKFADEEDFQTKAERLARSASIQGTLYCTVCDDMTPFTLGAEYSFCMKCGTIKNFTGVLR